MSRARKALPIVVLLLVAGVGAWLGQSERHRAVPEAKEVESQRLETAAEAFAARRSDVWVEDEGTVVALLRDDDEGSRHQRLLVRLDGGTTLLVAHNIDLAPRVPVEKGERVSLRGEYVWNDKGGLVHWTHRDPAGRHPGGWIRHKGREYR